MIERQGQLYGPYSSQQEAVREAVYVANYSINHGLQAEVIVQNYRAKSTGARAAWLVPLSQLVPSLVARADL